MKNTNQWKSSRLGDLLNEEQLNQVAKILGGTQGLERKAESLKKYLGKFRDALNSRGLDSEFLAYAIAYNPDIRRLVPTRKKQENYGHKIKDANLAGPQLGLGSPGGADWHNN